MVQLRKYEVSLVPKTHIKIQAQYIIISCTSEAEKEKPWDLLANKSIQISVAQVQWKSLSQKKN